MSQTCLSFMNVSFTNFVLFGHKYFCHITAFRCSNGKNTRSSQNAVINEPLFCDIYHNISTLTKWGARLRVTYILTTLWLAQVNDSKNRSRTNFWGLLVRFLWIVKLGAKIEGYMGEGYIDKWLLLCLQILVCHENLWSCSWDVMLSYYE